MEKKSGGETKNSAQYNVKLTADEKPVGPIPQLIIHETLPTITKIPFSMPIFISILIYTEITSITFKGWT